MRRFAQVILALFVLSSGATAAHALCGYSCDNGFFSWCESMAWLDYTNCSEECGAQAPGCQQDCSNALCRNVEGCWAAFCYVGWPSAPSTPLVALSRRSGETCRNN